MVRKAVILDCDPGVDDALAIALALASSELRVLAITTTHGNAPAVQGTENALRVLEVLRRTGLPERLLPPVYRGSAYPLKRAPGTLNLTALDVHGGDGLGGISRKLDRAGRPLYSLPSSKKGREGAISALLRIAEGEGRRLTVIATGPLTNLARALRVSGSPLRGVREIILMGGTALEPGNSSPVAEFNIFCDPEAAREVFSSGVPITMVGLDVTRKVILRREHLKGGRGFFRFLREITRHYMRFHREARGVRGCFLHDPLAVGVAIDPSFVRRFPLRVEVETGSGPARGMTVVERRSWLSRPSPPPHTRVCLEVRAEGFLKFFLGRMRGLDGGRG